MKKQSKLVLTGIVLLIALTCGGYYAYLLANEPKASSNVGQPEPVATESTDPTTDELSSETTVTEGGYVSYQSQDEVIETDGTKILFFHAPWCPQCRQLDSELSAADIPNGVTIFKTDYDSNQNLRAKYGVTLQTTFVAIDSQGELIKKYVAYNEPTFDTLTRDFIAKL